GRQVVTVGVGAKRESVAELGRRRLQQFVGRFSAKFCERFCADRFGELETGLFGDRDGTKLHAGGRAGGGESATLPGGFLEEIAGEGRGHEGADRERARGLAADGDVVRIAAENRDVFDYPFKGRDLIEESVVAGGMVARLGSKLGMRQKSEYAEAVVGLDH